MNNYSKKVVKTVDDEFYKYISESNYEIIIQIEDVINALGINTYFVNQKLILAGFLFETESGLCIKKLAENNTPSDKSSATSVDIDKDKIKNSLERNILTSSGRIILLTELSRSHKCNKLSFEIAAKQLETEKLGFYKNTVCMTTGRKKASFTKIEPSEFNGVYSLELVNNLKKYHLKIPAYEEAYNKTD